MFNPLFDVSKMSDRDIMNKLDELNQRLIKSRLINMHPSIIDTITSAIVSCEEELYSRSEHKQLEKEADIKCVFDIEKDYLTPKEDKDESKRKQNFRPQW